MLERLGLVEVEHDDTYVLAMVSCLGGRREPAVRADALRRDPGDRQRRQIPRLLAKLSDSCRSTSGQLPQSSLEWEYYSYSWVCCSCGQDGCLGISATPWDAELSSA